MFSEGDRLGAFDITGLLGKGGMGEVYRARDTKLGREVAIKVLPNDVAKDPERLTRFEREAKVLASLDHPSIGTLHDFRESDGIHYLVLQLIEGDTLEDRIQRGPLSITEALPLFLQIAEALEAAHARGVVHRDLKPANIKVSDDGQVKVLDFGIAKTLVPEEPEGGPVSTQTPSSPDAPTIPSTPTPPASLTGPDMLIGTPAYMSPEQARGKPVDKRADIWAFGCCLFEALSGIHPFRDESTADTISKIIKEEVDFTPLPKNLPKSVHTLIARCLEKDTKRRLRDIGEAWVVLKDVTAGAIEAEETVDQPKRRRSVGMIVGAFALGAIGAVIALPLFRPQSGMPDTRGAFTISPLTSLLGVEYQVTWSPDGNFIAYDSTKNGSLDIYVQSVAGDRPRLLVDGAADDASPRWSPDGRYIAFWSGRDEDSSIYLVPALSGPKDPARRLAPTFVDPIVAIPKVLGANPWSPDSRHLLFSREEEDGRTHILKIDIETGEETQLTFPGENEYDLSATWSHDGARIAFTREKNRKGHLWLMSSQGEHPREILPNQLANQMPAWTRDDKIIVFISGPRGSQNLWEIDVDLPGEPRTLIVGPGSSRFPVVSIDGRIAYSETTHVTDLYAVSIDSGTTEQLTVDTDDNFGARYSPDGTEIAYHSQKAGNNDIWILDLGTLAERQLTFAPEMDIYPDWSPEGDKIVFISSRSGDLKLWIVDAQGGVPRQLTNIAVNIHQGDNPVAADGPRWSPDGKAIAVRGPSEKGMSLWVVNMDDETVRTQLDGISGFEWYRDSRHVIYFPTSKNRERAPGIWAANLDTGEEKLLYEGPHRELAVSRDGQRVSYVLSESHFNMNLHMFDLSPPDMESGLPSRLGEPVRLTDGQGRWHVHNGGWSPDGKEAVYTRDTDTGNIYAIDRAPESAEP